MNMIKNITFIFLSFFVVTFPQKAAAQDVDIEIVLAVDGSGSISTEEFKLQLAGYAAAFRDPAIQSAITSGPIGRVAVSMLLWSDAAFQKFTTGWYVLKNAEDANRYAVVLQNFYKHSGRTVGIGGGGTGIGSGVAHAMNMMDENKITAIRQVIDVSGDGIETEPFWNEAIMMPDARKAAERRGVMINGLAILTDFHKLDEYYRNEVITGPGSFVIKADSFDDFGKAIRRKLWLEFSNQIASSPEEIDRRIVAAQREIYHQ